MTDKEIIRVLNHIAVIYAEDLSTICGIRIVTLLEYVLDLINRKDAEIKSLTEKLEALGDPLQDAQYKIAEQQAEIERLKAEQMMADGYAEALEQKAKAEAIKEFVERYENIKTDRLICSFCCFKDGVDDLVKEMVGDILKIEHNSLCETETYKVGE